MFSQNISIGLYADRLRLPKALVFRREPYITAIVLSGSGFGDESNPKELRIITEPARGVKAGKPLDLGPLKLFEGDPRGFLYVRLQVWESDEDFRRAGELIARARERLNSSALAKMIVDGALGSLGIARVAAEEFMGQITERLRKAGDDLMLDSHLDLEFTEKDGQAFVSLGRIRPVLLEEAESMIALQDARGRAIVDVRIDGCDSAGAPPVPFAVQASAAAAGVAFEVGPFSRATRWNQIMHGDSVRWEGDDEELVTGVAFHAEQSELVAVFDSGEQQKRFSRLKDFEWAPVGQPSNFSELREGDRVIWKDDEELESVGTVVLVDEVSAIFQTEDGSEYETSDLESVRLRPGFEASPEVPPVLQDSHG